MARRIAPIRGARFERRNSGQMNDDELHRPLGQNARKAAEKAKASNPRRTWMIFGGVLGVVGAGALALAARDPLG